MQQSPFQNGLLALKEDRVEDALQEFTSAERDQPNDATIRNFRGIVLARLGRLAEAASEYRQAITMDPALEPAYRNLGFLEWNNHQLPDAVLILEAALKLSPQDSFARYYLGRVHLEQQEFEAAFLELQRSGMPLPKDPDVQMLAAKGYIALGRQSEAREIAGLLASERLTAIQTSRLASLLLTLHDNDAAISLLQRWNGDAAHTRDLWAAFDLSIAYVLVGNPQQAADQAQLCTDPAFGSPSKLADAWSLVGIADARLGHKESSIQAFRRATTLSPQTEEHWLNLTRELMEVGQLNEAIASTERAIELHPSSYALQLRLGAANLSVSRYKEAEEIFRRLISAGDPLPTSYIGLAQVLLRTGRADQAVAELAAARQTLGPSFLLSYFQGLSLSRAGMSAEAVSALTEAVREEPGNADAHFELGKNELKLGYFDGAIAEFENALRLNPTDPRPRHLLTQARQRSGRTATVEDDPSPVRPPAIADLVADFILPQWI